MNRIYPQQKSIGINLKNGDKLNVLFFSFRLIQLIAKKSNLGEWAFTYFKIDQVDLGSGYVIGLVGLEKTLIAYKE